MSEPNERTKLDWDEATKILDEIQAICAKYNVGLLHDEKSVQILRNTQNKERVCTFLYITPGRMGYSNWECKP